MSPRLDVRPVVGKAMRVHPRVAYQGFCAGPEERVALALQLPPLVPFPGTIFQSLLPILDWDHRLPSRRYILRIYAYYDDSLRQSAEQLYGERLAEIDRRDEYPEFDVTDFSDLPAHESYEVDITPDGAIEECRFVSPWRGEVPRDVASQSLQIARKSEQYHEIVTSHPERSTRLGDLQVVSWCPPCESGHAVWTVDVWFLVSFDGRFAEGKSFLVDVDGARILSLRDFRVRSG